MLKDLRHELAAEVNGQQNLFVQLDVHPHALFLCECGSVEVWRCGCEGVGSMGVTVWESADVSVGVGKCRYMYVGVGVWRSVGMWESVWV